MKISSHLSIERIPVAVQIKTKMFLTKRMRGYLMEKEEGYSSNHHSWWDTKKHFLAWEWQQTYQSWPLLLFSSLSTQTETLTKNLKLHQRFLKQTRGIYSLSLPSSWISWVYLVSHLWNEEWRVRMEVWWGERYTRHINRKYAVLPVWWVFLSLWFGSQMVLPKVH